MNGTFIVLKTIYNKPEIVPKTGNKGTSLEHQIVLQQCGQLAVLLDGNRPLDILAPKFYI